MKLIDADVLLKYAGNCYDEDDHLLYAVGTGTIMRMPTIDAVRVVRCKDCKNRWPDLDEGKMICLLERSRRADDDEWFCADGKRRTAESE